MENILYPKLTATVFKLKKVLFTVLLLTSLLFSAGESIHASSGTSQNKKISLDLKNVTIKKVFEAIKQQTNYSFFFETADVNIHKTVSVKVTDTSVREILDKILEGQHITYEVKGNHIILTAVASKNKEVTQQKNKISGTILDEAGLPVIGANVIIKGTTQGTITDIKGWFSIEAGTKDVLLITYIGYLPREIAVGSQKQVQIVLQEDSQKLDEVVVIGYGSQSREMVTTSITKLDTKALKNVPYSNIGSALQGTVSGVRVQSTSGQPGAAPRIIVRGGTSINNPDGASPLYIIDGVIRNQMNDISSDDIESIQVLKDAASTSIYGARGSNGVVIITTKSGKTGKTTISYKYNMTISNIGKLYDMASAKDYLTLTRTGMIAASKFPDMTSRLSMPIGYGTGNDLSNKTVYSTQYLTDANKHKLNEGWQSMPDPIDPTKTLIFSDTDFQALTYQTGMSHNHYAEVNGGTDKATFNAGLGYLSNEGTVINTKYNRFSFNLNGSVKVFDNLKVSGRALYSSSNIKGSTFAPNITFYRSAGLAPTAKVYFEDGTLSPGANSGQGNPLYHMYSKKNGNQTDNLTLSLDAEWKITPELSFVPQISMYTQNNDAYSFQPAFWNGPLTYYTNRDASATNARWRQYQADAVFNYIKSFKEDHHVSGTAGFSYYARNNSGLIAQGRGASSDLIPTLNAASTPTAVTSTITDQVLLGYFVRANYSYKEKYLLSVNARYDGASNLGEKNKWGIFPGVSLGWHVHKEKFWSFLPTDLLRLKVRASYGVNGNIGGLGDFTAGGNYGVGSKYAGGAGVVMTTMANQDLKWEQSKTFDIGTDIGLLNGRINILFDYYNRVTDNLITNLALPPSTGFSSILTNLGSLENRGIEFEVAAQVLPSTSPVQWNISLNASKVKNKIKSLPYNGMENNRVGGVLIWDPKANDYVYKGGLQEGGTLGELYTYKQIGIYATDEEAKSAPVDNLITVVDKTKYGGDVNWLDADNNGIINDKDKTYMGNIYPTWTGGLANTLRYKGFDLYFRLDFTTGHTIYNYAKAFLDYNWLGDNVMTQDVVDRSWKKQGDKTDMPRHYWAGDRGQQNAIRENSLYYESGDFLSIRELSLSYTLPSKLLQKVRLGELRFTVTGNNLYYFTKYSGLNPEEGGKDDGRYAMPRNIILGANISF